MFFCLWMDCHRVDSSITVVSSSQRDTKPRGATYGKAFDLNNPYCVRDKQSER
mgnify:CR=1 FL=1